MRKIALYSPRAVVGESFKGQPRLTVPSQSLSLREILRRFVRREPLPTSRDGIYEERFGDIEKIAHMDIVEQLAFAEDLKSKVAAFNDREKVRLEKEAEEAEAARLADIEAKVEARLQAQAREGKPAQNPAP